MSILKKRDKKSLGKMMEVKEEVKEDEENVVEITKNAQF
jgi:hypothetical protein